MPIFSYGTNAFYMSLITINSIMQTERKDEILNKLLHGQEQIMIFSASQITFANQ